jgi:peptidoglycan/LPS O-acetylase OafA/YrhL
MKKRLEWVDGIKALGAIGVCVFHYVLAFYPKGYVGFSSGVPPEKEAEVFWSNFPWSIVSNASFPLYLFFGLIAFLPAYKCFKDKSVVHLKVQAIKRYFRFIIPVVSCTLIAYAFWKMGICKNRELADFTGSSWLAALVPESVSLKEALYSGFINVFIHSDDRYYSALWCMNLIFIGSYAVYAFLGLYGRSEWRVAAYVIMVPILFLFPQYATFFFVIPVAELCAKGIRSETIGKQLIVLGLGVGLILPVPLTPFVIDEIIYAVGATLVLTGCVMSEDVQKILSAKWLSGFGKMSFSLILTHFFVLQAFSAPLFIVLAFWGISFYFNLFLTMLLSVVFIWMFTVAFYECIEEPSEKLVNKMYKRFFDKSPKQEEVNACSC